MLIYHIIILDRALYEYYTPRATRGVNHETDCWRLLSPLKGRIWTNDDWNTVVFSFDWNLSSSCWKDDVSREKENTGRTGWVYTTTTKKVRSFFFLKGFIISIMKKESFFVFFSSHKSNRKEGRKQGRERCCCCCCFSLKEHVRSCFLLYLSCFTSASSRISLVLNLKRGRDEPTLFRINHFRWHFLGKTFLRCLWKITNTFLTQS